MIRGKKGATGPYLGSCAGSLILVTDLWQQVYHPTSGGIADGWTISSVLWIGEPA